MTKTSTPPVSDATDLTYTDEVARETAAAYERVKHFIPAIEWPTIAPYVKAINDLKKKKNAVILAHNYQTPEIYHCVADYVGDSLQLAKEAAKTDADIIVQAGVHFMAETSKILSPEKTVLIPDPNAGCSLASAVTGEDVRALKAKYPGVPVVTYVNTSADVKAESDVCCTSSNAVQVVESLDAPQVILIPDEYLARNVAAQTDVEIITWSGRCEVHERFTADEVREIKEDDPDVVVLAHPECPPDVIKESDFAGSTAAMIEFVEQRKPKKVVMFTECSMSDNVAIENPDVEFVRPCNMCPHMKRITLQKILHSLQTMTFEIVIPEDVAECARAAVERMVTLKLPKLAGPYDYTERDAYKDIPVENRVSVGLDEPRSRVASPETHAPMAAAE